jgi:DNA transformation protein and related proteins
MSYSQSVADELLDLMKGVGRVSTKKMFGALGFYQGPVIFACLFDGDIFYLKATGTFADELKSMGSQPFIYSGKSGKTVNMPYWTAPPACLDDADKMVLWCKKALANQSDSPKSASKSPTKKAPTKKR